MVLGQKFRSSAAEMGKSSAAVSDPALRFEVVVVEMVELMY